MLRPREVQHSVTPMLRPLLSLSAPTEQRPADISVKLPATPQSDRLSEADDALVGFRAAIARMMLPQPPSIEVAKAR